MQDYACPQMLVMCIHNKAYTFPDCADPLSCDLGQVVKQLAHLGCYDGLLDLPLRRAAAVDPERAARLPGEAGRAAREVIAPHLRCS